MKYLKTFENVENLKLIDILTDFLKKILKEKTNYKFKVEKGKKENRFWYDEDDFTRCHIFRLVKIDHYYDDEDIFFEFILDTALGNNMHSGKEYIPEDLYQIVLFFKEIMNRYSNFQNCISISNISKIIEDINKEFDLYINTYKYNL